jgi:hypothetical protein
MQIQRWMERWIYCRFMIKEREMERGDSIHRWIDGLFMDLLNNNIFIVDCYKCAFMDG